MAKEFGCHVTSILSWLRAAGIKRSNKIVVHSGASDGVYGRLRIKAELNEQGIMANGKRIARLMRQKGLRGVSRRCGYVVTTRRDRYQRPAPDLVNRHLSQPGLIRHDLHSTRAGFLYLAVVIDVFSRKVVGWSFGESMTAH